MVYDETNVGEVSFLSETLGIAIENGDLFLYFGPSKKQVPCYKSNSDSISNDREVIYSPKWRRLTEDDPTVVIIGTTSSIKNKWPLTDVSTQGNDLSNVTTSLYQLKDGRFIFMVLEFDAVVVKVSPKWRLHQKIRWLILIYPIMIRKWRSK